MANNYTPEQIANKFRFIINNLNKIIVTEVMSVANDANAVITKRVQGTGKNDAGSDFGTYAYSTQKIKKRKGHDLPPFPHVNFTDTGQMFNDIKPQILKVTSDSITIRIAPDKTENMTKLEDNVDRFGEILKLSKQERQDIEDDMNEAVAEKIVQIFNSY